MASFPVEILERIFSFCDGKTLVAAATSCEFLYNLLVVNPTLHIKKAWKDTCSDTIPSEYKIDILESLYPKYFYTPDEIDWTLVYRVWNCWSEWESWSLNVKKRRYFFKIPASITTSVYSGNWVIAAVKDCLYAINIHTKKHKLIFKDSLILSIKCYCDEAPECVDTKTAWLPGVLHDKVYITLDRNIDAILNLRSGAVKNLNRIDRTEDFWSFANHKIEVTRSENLNLVEATYQNIFKPFNSIPFNFQNQTACLIDMWDTKGTFYYNGKLLTVDFMDNITFQAEGSCFDPRHKTKHLFMNRYCRLFTRIENFHLIDQRFFVQVDSSQAIYQPFFKINLLISCATFRAGILFFGSQQGVIVAYKVDDLSDLLSLDLENCIWFYDLEQNNLKTSHILNIEVQFSEIPCLWVTTKRQIFKIPLLKSPFPSESGS